MPSPCHFLFCLKYRHLKCSRLCRIALLTFDIEELMDVNQVSTDLLMSSYPGFDLIHGHTHRQNTHTDGKYTRYVLGDWSTKNGNAIKLTDKLEWLEIN